MTLAVPLGENFEADPPVTPWDPAVIADDKRAVAHAVWVRLDGQDGTIRANVTHEVIPLGRTRSAGNRPSWSPSPGPVDHMT